MKMKILITGSSGTIGTRLCERLLEQGFEVIGADWKKNKWKEEVDKITVNIDLRNKPEVLKKLPKVDLVIHLAANARVYDLTVEPDRALDNILTVYNMLEFCRINKIQKFMFASSRETYGNSSKITQNESDALIENCESPYAASKIAGEALTRAYGKCYNLDFLLFRFSNVYGMYDESDRVVPLFIRLCKQKKDLIVFGKEKLLDFTYIDDTVSAIIECIKNFEKVKNDTFNIAQGSGTKILEVAEIIKKLLKTDNKIILQENRTGEVVKYIADISKIKSRINYNPQVGIEEGIKKSIDWYNKHIN
jgi:UDP-glucose 4-epimerase